MSIYHLQKTSIGLKRKYLVSADDGAGRPGDELAYAEKQLKVADEIIIYRDEQSLERTTWEFEQPGLGRLIGAERSLRTARLRRLVSLGGGTAGEIINAVTKYHFDFERDGEPMFSIEKPKVLADWYRLVVHEPAVNTVLLFALAITMEARQRG